MSAQEKLANRCQEIADLGRAAIEWVKAPENSEQVGNSAKSNVKVLRRVTRRADKLARAARTRMSVSVFGPSQAGKSFLVSVLGRPADDELVAAYDDPAGQLNYLRDVNPEGQGESTGLVTRFTMVRDKTPPGFPIKLSLLSEADIIRAVLNSFFNDGDGSETPPEPADLNAHLERFEIRAGNIVPGLEPEDILEIGEYVERVFGRSAYAAALRGFWEDASEIAPRLSPVDRQSFFQITWGGHRPFSDLYRRLADGLAMLSYAETVYAGLDALIPRDTSIIDVKTLKGLSGVDVGPPVKVRGEDGHETVMARADLCALAAEMHFPMRTQPSEVLGRTDLLDFPGARNRFDLPLSVTLAPDKVEINLQELLLRGKVAYLFDRYVENQEITSMLLCVPGSNMETVSLPGLIENWIAMTHGASSAMRSSVETVLFFVLTKFDELLVDSGADGGATSRFQRRIEASLLEKFTKGKDNWVAHWRDERPFTNCFWLRNPKYPAESVITYEDGREVALRTDKESRLNELRAGYLKAEAVNTHFANPAAAWDAAMALNDGGVTYLTEALTRVAKPDSKLRQIQAQLEKLIQDAYREVANYYVSNDIHARIEEKRIAAGRVIDGVEKAYMAQRFGSFLGTLLVDQDEIEARISRVPSAVRIRASGAAATGPTGNDAGAGGLKRPGGLRRPGTTGPHILETEINAAQTMQSVDIGVRSLSLEEYQARTALELWIDALKSTRDNPSVSATYGVEEVALADLVGELIHAQRRLRMVEALSQSLEATNFGLTAAEQAPPAAILCAEHINHFVTTLGAAEMPDAERPIVADASGVARPIFTLRPRAESADTLPAKMYPTAQDHVTDWIFALEALFVANAKDCGSGSLNIEQNVRLGSILSALASEKRAT